MGRHSSLVTVERLRSFIALIAALASALAIAVPLRPQLPVVPLLSSITVATSANAPYVREGDVRWPSSAVLTRPFAARYAVEFFPDVTFELIFDTKLSTHRTADSFAGIALDDPGSMAVLTHLNGQFKLTVDSPRRGHFSVHAQSDGRYVARQYTGRNASHGADDFEDIESRLTHVEQVLPKFDPLLSEVALQLASYTSESPCDLFGVTVGVGVDTGSGGASAPTDATVPRPAAGATPRMGGSLLNGLFGAVVSAVVNKAINEGCKKLESESRTKEITRLEARSTSLKAEKARYEILKIRLRDEIVRRRLDRAPISQQPSLSLAAYGSGAPLDWSDSGLRAVALGDAASDAPKWSPTTASTGPVVDSFAVGASCADSPGRIDVAVVASDALSSLYSTKADKLIWWTKIVHGFDITNAALRASNVSTPGLDTGFAIANLIDEPLSITIVGDDKPVVAIGDDSLAQIGGDDTADNVYRTYSPRTLSSDAVGLFRRVDDIAPKSDVVVVIVAGDRSTSASRGAATETKDVTSDLNYSRRLAVVKSAAFDAEYFYTLAHELGHTLGAGHDHEERDMFQVFAQGAVVESGDLRWASLMALSECPKEAKAVAANPNRDCRRVPYYSSATLNYPAYGGKLMGGEHQDNSGAMRLIRDDVTRMQCSRKVSPQVWLQKGSTVAAPNLSKFARTESWETQSIWVRPDAYVKLGGEGSRSAYQHATLSESDRVFFPTVLLQNANPTAMKGTMEFWRARRSKEAALLLSPRLADLERLTACSVTKDTLLELDPARSNLVQAHCENADGRGRSQSLSSSDIWALRWTDVGAKRSENELRREAEANPLLADLPTTQPTFAWRSVRAIDLPLDGSVTDVVMVRNSSKTAARQVNVRIEPVLNQYNFNVRDTGLDTIVVSPARCRTTGSKSCLAQVTQADDTTGRQTLELTLPPDSFVKISLTFKRTTQVPLQNLLLRVVEEELAVGQPIAGQAPLVVGGTSYILRYSPPPTAGSAVK